MAMGTKMAAAINDQINAELYSSYLYLSMSAWTQTQNMRGFAAWLAAQAKEENAHAMKFFEYLVERGAAVRLKAIDAPPTEWTTPLEVFKNVAEHERKVTSLITKLADLADAEKDRPAAILLQWFIKEQVEEESSADEIVAKLALIQDSAAGLMQMDKTLGRRGE